MRSAFALPPSGSRELRLEVAVPPDAEGTHHAMVFVTVVPPPTETPGVGVATTTRVGLTVYVTVSGTERSGSELVDFYQPDAATLAAVVVNTGNTVMRLGGVVELRDEAGDVVHRFPCRTRRSCANRSARSASSCRTTLSPGSTSRSR